MNYEKCYIAEDVEAVVTSFNQGPMIREAVDSLCGQTMQPARIIIVDDGSTDEESIGMLRDIETDGKISVPVTVVRQPNGGVSSARNAGIGRVKTPMALIMDGDDRLKPSYIEQVSTLLRKDASMVAASSWMHAFGALDAEIRPGGGGLDSFLVRNCCPATHILRRKRWERCGGYDESMRSGFEDWDFFLSILETAPGARIGIVEEPLIDYRTAPASSNVKSMSKRLELMGYIIEKHRNSYQEHLKETILGLESISMERLCGWEGQICCAMDRKEGLSPASEDFMKHPSYGDGGMAAAVRISSLAAEASR